MGFVFLTLALATAWLWFLLRFFFFGQYRLGGALFLLFVVMVVVLRVVLFPCILGVVLWSSVQQFLGAWFLLVFVVVIIIFFRSQTFLGTRFLLVMLLLVAVMVFRFLDSGREYFIGTIACAVQRINGTDAIRQGKDTLRSKLGLCAVYMKERWREWTELDSDFV